MLGFVLILIFLKINQSSSNLFMIKQYREYLCLTSSNDGLAFITPAKLQSYEITSENLPHIRSYEYNCDINYQWKDCDPLWMITPWKIVNSLEGDINDYILDRRWQNLKETAAIYPRNHEFYFYTATTIRTSNFEIPFSLRTENEAHVYLCDGEDPRQSNCYWFLLEAWSGTITALRKCKQHEIPNESSTPYGNCAKSLAQFSHVRDSFDYLTERQWRHFKLIKRQNRFELYAMRRPLIVYNDAEKSIDIQYMIIHSRNLKSALWRIHDYQYLWSDREYDDVLGPLIDVENSIFCVSMFVAMCDVCELHLSLFEIQSKNTYFREIYTPQSKGWQEIKYKKEGIKFKKVQLHVQTIARDTINKHFWAIDSFKVCQEKEYNVIRMSGPDGTACQRIAAESDEILTMTDISDSLDNKNCSIDANNPTIGDECFPCQLLYYRSCRSTKYCQNDNIGRPVCTCSAGYFSNNCDYYCPYQSYGVNCQKTCGHCDGDCDKVDGSCPSCRDGFKGARCDIPDSGAILKNPPTVRNVSYTSCLVQQDSFNFLTNEYGKNEPKYYEIQFQDPSDVEQEWHIVDRYDFGDSRSVLVDNLQSDTKFLIRSMLIDEYNEYTDDGKNIPVATCRTLCHEINQDNIQVTPSNVSVTVTILVDKTNCKMQYCQVVLGKTKLRTTQEENAYFIDNLQPFTDYKISVENCGNISPLIVVFKTLEGRPSKILDLTVLSKTSTTVELQWNKPKYECGIIRYYKVIYEHILSKACSTTNQTQALSLESNTTIVKIENLQPYSRYSIKIAAITVLPGDYQVTQIETEESDTVSADELPNILRVTPASNSVEIKLNPSDCNLIRGGFSIQINGSCTNPWCVDSTPLKYLLDYRLDFNISDLSAYSTYNFDINFCRMKCRKIEPTTTITTKENSPYNNFNESIYAIDTTSISIRLKEPHPPTGVFESFLIVASSKRYRQWITKQTEYIQRSTHQCEFWPQFYCVTFDNLQLYESYRFEISAKNMEPVDYSRAKIIEKYLQIDEPAPPYGLSLNWTIDDKLTVSWKHPNYTSGDSTTFVIQVDSPQTNKIIEEISFDKDHYNSTYSHMIKSTIITATRYRVVVKSKNQFYASIGRVISDSSPPPVPSLHSNPDVDFSNSTITLNISYMREMQSINSSMKVLISNGNRSNVQQRVLDRMPEMDLEIHRIVSEQIITNNIDRFVITEDAKGAILADSQQYTITLILINQFGNKLRSRIYTTVVPSVLEINEAGDGISIILPILLCLIIIVVIAFVIIKRKSLQSNFDEWKQRFVTDKSSDGDQLQLAQIPDTKPIIAPKPQMHIEKQPLKESSETKQGKYSKRIKITDFEDYVKESIENGELERQHALFPRGKVKSCSYGEMKVNKSKNRYNNLIAYDHSRVILDKIDGDQYSDYINANYIDGYKALKAYIATQGPKPNTLYDFWRMIWQNNTECIVMLANVQENGKKKVEKYWPDINEQLQLEDIHIQYMSNKVFADYEIREFHISKDNEQRKIKQLHFMTWPDHGVPLYSRNLVPFLQEMLKIPNNSRSPVVVHCSAGVGRTGTIILCDIALRMAAREGAIDVLNILEMMRHQRSNLVDNYEQYKLAHLVILECLVGMHTSIPCNEIETIVQQIFKVNKIKIQMDYLERTAWQDQAMNTVSQIDEAPVYDEKNRIKDIIPAIQGRVFLTRYPVNDETSSYINAVKVDAFRNPGRFIVTQQPLPNTVGDFWRLIIENDVTVVVSLNTIDRNDKSCCEFWPTQDNPEMLPVDFLQLKYGNTKSTDCYDVTTIEIHNKRSKSTISVEIISMKNWPSKQTLPKAIDDFLTFWEETDLLCRRSEKVTITCYDGALACGVYVAMCFIIEKMKLEQNCDVCHAVRTIRQNRHQFVQDEAQFRFLYEAAVKYINVFQSYANFK